jgi:hypothetical protein
LIATHELAALFQRGPALLLVDGDDPDHRGLPEGAAGSVLLVQLAGDQDRDRLLSEVDPLEIRYGNGPIDGFAAIAARGYLGIIGRGVDGGAAVALRNDRLARLGPDPQLLIGSVLAALNLAPPAAVWNFPVTDVMAEALAAECVASKPAALALARATGVPVWLGLRKDAAGLRVLMPPHDSDRHDLLLMPETKGVDVGEAGIVWQQLTASAGEQEMFVPWDAIWAMRTADVSMGWVWALDLPKSLRDELQTRSETWAAMRVFPGLPLPPPPELKRALILAPPSGFSPIEALRWSLRLGAAIVVVDGYGEGVVVPSGLRDQAIVAVPHGLPLQSSLVLDEDGIVANLPDADGSQSTLRAPWSALLAVQALSGFMPASWSFPQHASDALKAQMAVDRYGVRSLTLEQPCGMRTPAGQPTLHVEFQLPPHELH